MPAGYLVLACAGVMLALGTLHLLYTFRGSRLLPRDPALQARMDEVHPVITRETTMWRAWVGFNASHAMGAMLFGLVYGYLGLAAPSFLFGSPFLLCVGAAMLAGYVVLGRRYWFSVPFRGIVLATICYLAGLVLAFR